MLIVGALLMSAAIVLAFMRPTAGVVCAYAGVWALRTAGYCPVATATILFWAIAVLLVVSIDMARHTPLLIPFRARCFITGGALAAMAIGIAIWPNGTIICTAAGVILGLIAYAGTARIAHSPKPARTHRQSARSLTPAHPVVTRHNARIPTAGEN